MEAPPAGTTPAPDAPLAGARERTVATPTGPVRCLVAGPPPGPGVPAVLLVHGSGGDAQVWIPMLRCFSNCAVFAMDLPGRGTSQAPRLPSVQAYAAFLDDLRSALGLARVVVVGQSLGGAIAQHYARDFEARCAGVVLANTAADFSIGPDRIAAIDQHWDATAEHYARGQVSPRASADLRAAALRMVRARDREAFKADLAVCSGFDAKPWLQVLRPPVLVVVGADDTLVVPARSQVLYAQIPQAAMVTLAPCGHCPMLEQPARLAALIESFALHDARAG